MRHASPIKCYAPHSMTHCRRSSSNSGRAFFLLLLLLLLLLQPLAVPAAEEPCLIRATLYATALAERDDQDFGLPLEIDCAGAGSGSGSAAFDLAAQRVAGKQHVRLDGSQTPPLDMASYGLEYLANCAQLQSVEIERFVLDASLNLSCGSSAQQLEQLRAVTMRHNELGSIGGQSFALLPHLQQLLLEDNSLRLLEALDECEELLRLSVRRERELALRQPDVLQPLQQLQRLELAQLKMISGEVLEALPGRLQQLLVQQTPIKPQQLRMSKGTEQLSQLELVECDLTSFTWDASVGAQLLKLNLSGNALRHLELQNSSVLNLDLSANHLRSLNSSWFVQLEQLAHLHLQQNELHRVSWLQLLQLSSHRLLKLDLSGNELLRLEDTEHAVWDEARQLSIRIDDNPWSCQWMLNFSHAQPQLFRLFRYAKYISQINVNGLSCRPQLEPATTAAPATNSQLSEAGKRQPDHGHLNVTSHTVLYGNPMQQSHSQRGAALIIVFLLPVGIALLFLLLYLYLHCERLFHWSYYAAGLPCFGGGKAARNHRFVDHIDIVRYPIANDNSSPHMAELELEPQADGYETPLSGNASICNCAGQRQVPCPRTHHVTYEVMTTELPYQLYSEIKEPAAGEEPAAVEADDRPAPTAPIYDHLTFEEVQPFEV